MTDGKEAVPMATGENGELTFEEALARLEKIVQEMEQGRLPLEECLKRFEEWAPFAQDQA